MSHDTHTTDSSIRELTTDLCTIEKLRSMAKGWKDPFPLPDVEAVTLADGKRHVLVVRDDKSELGSKARFGSLLVQRMKEDTIVYVAPRVGWAPISLARLCKLYNKRLILFAPASKTASDHQRVAVELGAEMRFHRIAAMPVLQTKAAEFAQKHGYLYAPLGLRHPLVTAAIVATADRIAKKLGTPPDEVWSAMSTGVLSRGLQLAWPDASFHGVAVARNIKAGERGRALIHSHPMPFLQDEKKALRPPFPSASNYDAKVWRFINDHAADGALFWNVAGEIAPTKPNKLKSDVPWGDESAFRRK
jgi:hypothetical protein